jgi:hypothetical protein
MDITRPYRCRRAGFIGNLAPRGPLLNTIRFLFTRRSKREFQLLAIPPTPIQLKRSRPFSKGGMCSCRNRKDSCFCLPILQRLLNGPQEAACSSVPTRNCRTSSSSDHCPGTTDRSSQSDDLRRSWRQPQINGLRAGVTSLAARAACWT